MMTTKRKIRISGNWRKGGPDREWAGTGTVDQYGAIECSADLGDEAYDRIEAQINGGQTEGRIKVESDDNREIVYYWEIEGYDA